jgi:hypothetical protein
MPTLKKIFVGITGRPQAVIPRLQSRDIVPRKAMLKYPPGQME